MAGQRTSQFHSPLNVQRQHGTGWSPMAFSKSSVHTLGFVGDCDGGTAWVCLRRIFPWLIFAARKRERRETLENQSTPDTHGEAS